jgi:hypothetical protein
MKKDEISGAHGTCEGGSAHRTVVGKPEGKRPLRRLGVYGRVNIS